ncbi:BgTH12-00911 [Blumeria graminis f. sp. triticale]|uniref:BgTH12-00911 n=1 Tax=Blumeria graminis f. sp. triticale TaxID=1689686 RepID=A0A9W4D5W8_BLUGR|nr:BgTH12-00911 [Blumeria graminis f. sp. triticale]
MADINNTKIILSTGRGNGLVATQDSKADNILILIRKPYIVLPDKASLGKICSWCLLPTPSYSASTVIDSKTIGSSAGNKAQATTALQRCSGCRVSQYCSAACQRADWKSIHSKECALLAALLDVPPTPVRALMRILISHRFGLAWDPRWARLEGHMDEMRNSEKWADALLQAKAAVSFARVAPSYLELAIAVLCRIHCNAFRATLLNTTPIGLCFEPTLALANHSCTPNAYVAFEGRNIMLRALVPVKKDEELFISYIDANRSYHDRKLELFRTYWFQCNCSRCEAHSDANDRNDERLIEAKRM